MHIAFHIATFVLLMVPTWAAALTMNDQVKINEFYFSGSRGGTYQDGFIELYNAGSAPAYLDGALIASGVDTFAQLCFRFPGHVGGTTVALEVGHYVLLAADAHDFAATDPTSQNLSHANFETYWSGEENPGDNSGVVDLVDVLELPFDLFFYPRLGQLLLATGEAVFARPCEPGEACGTQVAVIDWETVVDGIEYLDEFGEFTPRLRDEIDSGVILGIAPFSGHSAERRTPGQDSNNSRDDFVILDRPTPFTSLSGEDPRPRVPRDAALLSVFPNPFNNGTTIHLNLPTLSQAELSVYDLLGHHLITLYGGRFSGDHEIHWNGSTARGPLPSGLYFVSLESAHASAIKKVILTR